MTAEIAVYNRSGIALAADSAVTTTNGFSEKYIITQINYLNYQSIIPSH